MGSGHPTGSAGRDGSEPLKDPSHIGGLTRVLEIVGNHTHQPNAHRHRWVPASVDNPSQVRFGQSTDEVQGPFVDVLEVAQQ